MPLEDWKRRSKQRIKKGYSFAVTYGNSTFVKAEEFRELKKSKKTKAGYWNVKKAERMILYLINEFKKNYSSSKGYQIYANEVVERGIDILITKFNSPIIAIEVTNYSKNSYIPEKDIKRYIKNLTEWKCKRVLIITYPSNLYNRKKKYSYKSLLKENDIEIWIRPEQKI